MLKSHAAKAVILLLLSSSTYASKVTVSTFNINALVPIVSNSRVGLICEEIKHSTADIILLQEVWLKGYRQILKNCNYPHILDIDTSLGLYKRVENGFIKNKVLKSLSSFLSIFINPQIGYDTGLMILSRHPFQGNQEYSRLEFASNGNENYFLDGEIAVTKGAVATIVNILDTKVVIATTHLVANYTNQRYTDQRIKQLTQLKNWIIRYSKGLPTIVGGDFNFPTKSQLHKNIWQKVRSNIWPQKIFSEAKASFIRDTHQEGVLDRIFGFNGAKAEKGNLVFNDKKNTLSDHIGFQTTFNIDRHYD